MCDRGICKVFALESHGNLIKQVVLRANKTWLSRELCLFWLIDCSTVLHLDFLFTLHISTPSYYFLLQGISKMTNMLSSLTIETTQ